MSESKLRPYSYPDYQALSDCLIDVRDPATGHITQITVDDLYEAIKLELAARNEFEPAKHSSY